MASRWPPLRPVGPCRVRRARLGLGLAGLARAEHGQTRASERAAHPRDVPGANLALSSQPTRQSDTTCRKTLRAENGTPSSSRPSSLRSFQQRPCGRFSMTLYRVPA